MNLPVQLILYFVPAESGHLGGGKIGKCDVSVCEERGTCTLLALLSTEQPLDSAILLDAGGLFE